MEKEKEICGAITIDGKKCQKKWGLCSDGKCINHSTTEEALQGQATRKIPKKNRKGWRGSKDEIKMLTRMRIRIIELEKGNKKLKGKLLNLCKGTNETAEEKLGAEIVRLEEEKEKLRATIRGVRTVEERGHKVEICRCFVCKAKRGERYAHRPDCQCVVCKSEARKVPVGLIVELRKLFIPGKWISLSKEDCSYVQHLLNFRGTYAICSANSKDEVFYIGRGINTGGRIGRHGDIIKILEKEEKSWFVKIRKNKKRFEDKTLEARLIDRIRPRFNKQHNDGPLNTISAKSASKNANL